MEIRLDANRAARRLSGESSAEADSRAILALADALGLFDEGRVEPARAKLAEARTAWKEAEDRRADLRWNDLKRDLRSAASEIRAAGPAGK